MPAYDETFFDPPAPVAVIKLRHPQTGTVSGELRALLDTGADVTLLPEVAASEVGVVAEQGAGYELAGFDGRITVAPSAEIDLLFLGKVIRGRYLLYDRDYGILGRDVLNLVSLLMDGPERTWSGKFGPTKGGL